MFKSGDIVRLKGGHAFEGCIGKIRGCGVDDGDEFYYIVKVNGVNVITASVQYLQKISEEEYLKAWVEENKGEGDMNFQVGERVVVIGDSFYSGSVGTIIGGCEKLMDVSFVETLGVTKVINEEYLRRVSENFYQRELSYFHQSEATYTVEQFEKDIREAIEKIAKEGWKVEMVNPQMVTLVGGSIKVGEIDIDLVKNK